MEEEIYDVDSRDEGWGIKKAEEECSMNVIKKKNRWMLRKNKATRVEDWRVNWLFKLECNVACVQVDVCLTAWS